MSFLKKIALIFALTLACAHAAEDDVQLFLLIGQSNMAGRGAVEPQDKVPHPRVFMLTKQLTWVPAVDPVHFDKPDVAGVGLGSTFARVLAEAEPKAIIGLVPAAMGGSSLDEWKPGEKLYSNAVARMKEAMKRGQLKGILWHQGESDSAKEKAATYAERFCAMIEQLRKDLGAENVPLIIGETGRFRTDAAAINEVLAGLPELVP
ncbi:MAG TPA: sialate O-acetylesterase, partial [Opitutaceae bacterium]|nr:sialate O-acetylesterase [Opitutaceae bacterium]